MARLADCPKCDEPAFHLSIAAHTKREGTVTIRYSQTNTIRCSAGCKVSVIRATVKEATQAWNEKAAHIKARDAEAKKSEQGPGPKGEQ